MIDMLPRREKILTPSGSVNVAIEPGADVAMLIEHLIDEAGLTRGDIFELFCNDEFVPPETSCDLLPAGNIVLVATGGAV